MPLSSHDSIRIHDYETLHNGRVFDLVHCQIELPSGLRQRLDLIDHPGAVAIAARDDEARLVCVRQYRASIGDWMIEIPAGRLEGREDPLEAARRELEEETGHRAARWSLLRSIVPAPGFASEVIHLYLAEGLEAVTGGGLPCDEDEEIEVQWLSPRELIGATEDAKSLIAAFLLAN